MSTNGAASWIPDGYTEQIYFEEVEHLHEPLRFTYRPIIITTLAKINREMMDAGDDETKKQYVAAKWITQRIVSWDMKKPDKSPVDCHALDDVVRVRTVLFNRLWNCIGLGIDGGDTDPELMKAERQAKADLELAVSMSGEDKAVVLEKN